MKHMMKIWTNKVGHSRFPRKTLIVVYHSVNRLAGCNIMKPYLQWFDRSSQRPKEAKKAKKA